MGRPSSYRDEYAGQARKLARLGATDKEMADFFSVDEKTLNNWKSAHAEFLQSLKEGKAQSDAEVSDKLFRKATGYEHEAVKIFLYEGQPVVVPYVEKYAPDTTAAIFWLKNRRPDLWRDRVQQEHLGEGGGPLVVKVVKFAGDPAPE